MKNVVVCADSETAGQQAARVVHDALRTATAGRGRAGAIFASAPSQNQMLDVLASHPVDWKSVRSFHMDEYLGLDMTHPQTFGRWLEANLPSGALNTFERIRTDGARDAEITRYTDLLRSASVDISCVGVGVNGHLAFNEPYAADFDDPSWMREIRLDDTSRQQQVDDGLFPSISDVPKTALTLTVPALLSAGTVVCVVSGEHKADAVAEALLGPISSACPASALRTHENVTWFLDSAAAMHLPASAESQDQ